ncbi:MAG TPA: FadR/GntR family transcriptional regulator [Thermoflexales bacterium]|nr:FadR/GntR family transcriptional regulator [Thermoflexales bacterium]HQX10809.1 FadR/GntR family transcriptional regulator [Thermoflexales bacterium]HRA53830.1 FadR/GntR family transcriptional regulator [Thermoflexales bacterium]
MTEITKLKRETLSEQAAEQLSAWMDARGMRPGDVLPSQAELADQFGVSRTVVREAMRALAGRGVLDVVNGKGAVLKPLNSESLAAYFTRSLRFEEVALVEMMEVRCGLEMRAASLAAERRSEADVTRMRAIVSDMGLYLRQVDKHAELDLQLHLAIAGASRNRMLLHMIESIRESVLLAMETGMVKRASDDDRRRMQAEHETIVAAIQHHHPEAARQRMAEHIEAAAQRLAAATQTHGHRQNSTRNGHAQKLP